MYNHCQSRLVILKPNAPGSTNLCLSWIWQNTHHRMGVSADTDNHVDADADAGQFYKCIYISHALGEVMLTIFLVRRVHWLRSWAQSNRWKEEFLLVTYEMQWTMQYFIYHSQGWQSAAQSSNSPSGPLSYANCQHASWHKLAQRADKAFKLTNANYISPF